MGCFGLTTGRGSPPSIARARDRELRLGGQPTAVGIGGEPLTALPRPPTLEAF
jgi:hypothetical protein